MNKQYIFVWEPETQKDKPVYNALVKLVNEKNISDRFEVIQEPVHRVHDRRADSQGHA